MSQSVARMAQHRALGISEIYTSGIECEVQKARADNNDCSSWFYV